MVLPGLKIRGDANAELCEWGCHGAADHLRIPGSRCCRAALAWSFQAARPGADLADERLQASQYREQIADERTAAGRRVLAVERTVNDKYQGALNDAIQKQAGLQAAADRARRERDGLRTTVRCRAATC
jgi:hypothetical protein